MILFLMWPASDKELPTPALGPLHGTRLRTYDLVRLNNKLKVKTSTEG